MKVLQFILSLLIIVGVMEISRADDGLDIVAMKRPFCNAFTGCGRKRDPAYAVQQPTGAAGFQQLPIPVYRALMRLAAARNAGAAAAEIRMRQQLRPYGLQIVPELQLQFQQQPQPQPQPQFQLQQQQQQQQQPQVLLQPRPALF